MADQRHIDAILRGDLSSFIRKSFQTVCPAQEFHHNWHLEAISWHLQQCLAGKIRRLIITLPPRSLKSVSASVAYPAYVLGHDPTRRIICASYSSELADKHARDCRAVMQSEWYRRIFPFTHLSAERRAEYDFMTTMRGFRFATSVHGTLTGRGGNVIIIDDPMKSDDAMSAVRRKSVIEWFDNTIHTRLDDKKNDVIIIIMQRLHMDDLVGHILRKEGGGWVHLNLPAIAETGEDIPIGPGRFYRREAGELLHGEREPHEILDELRASMGSYHFTAQYQQNPIPQDGEIFKWGWFQVCEEMPVQAAWGDADRIVQSWDTASKAGELNDYSACTTWLVRQKKYYLLDVFRAKLNYPDLRRAIHDQSKKYRDVEILLEDTSSGTALLQDIKSTRIHSMRRIVGIKPEGDKVMRASSVSAVIEAGNVFLPSQAPWLEPFRAELLQFPNGRHDDQVDSLTQFLKWEKERPYRTVRFGRVIGHY